MARYPTGIHARAWRKVLAATLIIVSPFVLAQPAQATYYSGGFGTGYTVIDDYNYNSTWQPAMNYTVSAWNATPTPVDINIINGGNDVVAAQYSASWYGYYERSRSGSA